MSPWPLFNEIGVSAHSGAAEAKENATFQIKDLQAWYPRRMPVAELSERTVP